MLNIIGLENKTINLEKSRDLKYSFTIVSEKDNGRPIPFALTLLSNNNINAVIEYGNKLIINVDASLIMNEEHIVLTNTIGDKLVLKIIPNEYYTMDKTYTFKVTSKKLLDDGSLRLKILSKVNDMEIGWKCTYDGKPMAYSITPFENENSDYVMIVPMANIISEFDSLIEFTQEESGEAIKMILTNTPEMGITKIEKKVD